MDESEDLQPEPKISLPLAIFIGIFLVIISLINLIPFVGDITGPVVDGLMILYCYMSGLWNTSIISTNLIAMGAEMIPGIQAIPDLLIAWIVIVSLDHNPKMARVAAVVSVAGGVAGGAAAGGAAGGEGGAAGLEGGAVGEAGGVVSGAGIKAGEAGAGARAGGGAVTQGAAKSGGAAEGAATGSELGAPEENPEAARRREHVEDAEKEMRSGPEIPYNEEMEKELFDPEELKLRERAAAAQKDSGGDDDEARDEEEGLSKAA